MSAKARPTTLLALGVSVTSSAAFHSRSPYRLCRSARASILRKVAATRSRRSRSNSVRWRPKPLLVPVINQLALVLPLSSCMIGDLDKLVVLRDDVFTVALSYDRDALKARVEPGSSR